ncbi:hypothetical protein [Polaribacter irgensii]|nr:hypothetical protein [Polaribacter irgensii]
MIKHSKKTVFYFLLFTSIMTGISLADVKWSIVKATENGFKEILLPLIFCLLTINFLVSYVDKIKKENRKS